MYTAENSGSLHWTTTIETPAESKLDWIETLLFGKTEIGSRGDVKIAQNDNNQPAYGMLECGKRESKAKKVLEELKSSNKVQSSKNTFLQIWMSSFVKYILRARNKADTAGIIEQTDLMCCQPFFAWDNKPAPNDGWLFEERHTRPLKEMTSDSLENWFIV